MAGHHMARVGEQVGPYRLTRLLGAGGFGEVYEAEHRLLQQQRAIKLLLERHFHDPKARERFLREARTLAGLDHPNILPVLEVDEAGDLLYLVMPLYQRGTLSDLLKQQMTPLPLVEVERALAQICAALGYAHARSIAHLDLKPENLLLHEDGRLVLADFGLAHLLKQGRLEAGTSASWGTPYYMAPEQIQGNPEPRSDLYALGVMLYQILTMQRPFTGTTPEAVMMQHMLEAPPALHAAYPAAPVALEPVIQKALAKQLADRYQTAGALLLDFRAALGSPTPASTQPPAPATAPAAPTPPMSGLAPVAQPTVPAALNTPQAAAVCQIDDCGIQAIGRCATCGRAFCTSHQGRGRGYNTTRLVPFVDMCAPCAEIYNAEQTKRVQDYSEARHFFFEGAMLAKHALRTAGVPTVPIQWTEKQQEWQKGRFGVGGQSVEIEKVIQGRGWILGEFKWDNNRSGSEKVCLTALLDTLDRGRGLVPVQRGPKGYEVIPGLSNLGLEEVKAMQAVKRLAGISS